MGQGLALEFFVLNQVYVLNQEICLLKFPNTKNLPTWQDVKAMQVIVK